MANKRAEIKKKQIELIENNIKLIEIIFYIFRGQILDLDLKEFCMAKGLYIADNQYNLVIKKLVNNNILKIKKLVNTNNNVLVAKAPIWNYFNMEGKTTRYSVETVTRNSYIVYILIHKTSINLDEDIKDIVKYLENNTTLLSSKRDVESCYKMFNNKLNSHGKEAKLEAIHREEKRKSKLKNIEKYELEDVSIIYTETLQTLREKDIYFVGDKVIIIDNNSDYILSTLSRKIAVVIRVLTEQVDVDLGKLGIVVLVKSKANKRRLEDNFITKYKDGEKINIDKSISENIKKGGCMLRAEYSFKMINKNGLYILDNIYKTYSETFNKLMIKIENTDIAYKHNSDLKIQALIEKKKVQKEQNQREKIIEELRKNGLLKE